jgi:hypothetical protein
MGRVAEAWGGRYQVLAFFSLLAFQLPASRKFEVPELPAGGVAGGVGALRSGQRGLCV